MKCQIETGYIWKKDSYQERLIISLFDFYKNIAPNFIFGLPYYSLEDKAVLNKLSKNNVDPYSLKINNTSNIKLENKLESESEINIEIIVSYNFEYLEKLESKISCEKDVDFKYQSALFPQGLFLCASHSEIFKLFSGELIKLKIEKGS